MTPDKKEIKGVFFPSQVKTKVIDSTRKQEESPSKKSKWRNPGIKIDIAKVNKEAPK